MMVPVSAGQVKNIFCDSKQIFSSILIIIQKSYIIHRINIACCEFYFDLVLKIKSSGR